MAIIVGISGSLRRASINTGLLRAATTVFPEESQLAVHTLHGIPLYDADEELLGLPKAVTDLKEAVAMSDGVILASPEYNNSIPGVLKNAIDWMTRPNQDIGRVFGGKPVAVIGATPGGFGTILSQNAWLPVLAYLGTKPFCQSRLLISNSTSLFDKDGNLTDENSRQKLREFLQKFIAFVNGYKD